MLPYPSFFTTVTADGEILPSESWNFRQARSEPLSWSVVVDNSSGLYGPTSNKAYLKANPFITNLDMNLNFLSYSILHRFQIACTVGGVDWVSPVLFCLDYQCNNDPESSTITVSGSDMSELLLIEAQFMPDIIRGSAKDGINGTLSKFGIKNVRFINFPDYIVSLMHRVGCPMDWIRELLEIRQAWWYFDGAVFTIVGGGSFGGFGTTWPLTDRLNVKLLSYRISTIGVFNAAYAQRLDPNSGLAYNGSGVGKGFEKVKLRFPCVVAVPQITVTQAGGQAQTSTGDTSGLANTWTYYANDDWTNPVSTGAPAQGGIYIGSTPAKSVQFILQPSDPSYPPYEKLAYNLKIRGTRAGGGPPEPDYDTKYVDTADVGVHGLKPWRQTLVRSIISDQATNFDFCFRWVKESLMRANSAHIGSVMNPNVKLGDMVVITCWQARMSGHDMQVHSRAFSFTGDAAVMELECARPTVVG